MPKRVVLKVMRRPIGKDIRKVRKVAKRKTPGTMPRLMELEA